MNKLSKMYLAVLALGICMNVSASGGGLVTDDKDSLSGAVRQTTYSPQVVIFPLARCGVIPIFTRPFHLMQAHLARD